MFAHAEAAEHLRAALALGHPDRTPVLLALGEVQTVLGEYADALVSLETAAAASTPDDLPEVEHRLGRLQHRRGEYALARAHLEAALAGLPDDRVAARAAVTADLALATYSLGELDRAQELALRRRAAGRAGRRRPLAVPGAEPARDPGDVGGRHRRRRSTRCTAGWRSPSRPTTPSCGSRRSTTWRWRCRPRGSRSRRSSRPSAALELCAVTGDRHREAALHNNLADLMHATGRHEEAMAHLKAAVEIFAAVGTETEPRPEIWKLVRW